MRKSEKETLVQLSVLILCIFIFLGHLAWKRMKETAMLACLSSVAAEINKAMVKNNFEVGNQPRELTQVEVEQLLRLITPYDCSGSEVSSEEIHVAVGNVNKTSPLIKIKVWTNGADGTDGTDDDLVIPYGEKVY
jgi:hypothetical protein